MKKLFTLLALVLFISCNKECKDQEDAINQEYIEALKHASNPAAIEAIKRQRYERLSALDC